MAVFTRRHYIALELALARSAADDISTSARNRIICDVADMLAADNAAFDREHFIKACHSREVTS